MNFRTGLSKKARSKLVMNNEEMMRPMNLKVISVTPPPK